MENNYIKFILDDDSNSYKIDFKYSDKEKFKTLLYSVFSGIGDDLFLRLISIQEDDREMKDFISNMREGIQVEEYQGTPIIKPSEFR